MKKVSLVLLVLVLAVFTSCTLLNRGKTSNVKIEIGKSENFTKEEIEDTTNAVIKKFSDFEGCTLTDLWYDEKASGADVKSYHATKEDTENAIVLYSNFDVDKTGGDGGFNPNSTYTDWKWILKRADKNSKWQVIDWGY